MFSDVAWLDYCVIINEYIFVTGCNCIFNKNYSLSYIVDKTRSSDFKYVMLSIKVYFLENDKKLNFCHNRQKNSWFITNRGKLENAAM